MYSMRLAPGRDRIKGHFLENVIVKSLPGSIAVVLAVLAVNLSESWAEVDFWLIGAYLTIRQPSGLCVQQVW